MLFCGAGRASGNGQAFPENKVTRFSGSAVPVRLEAGEGGFVRFYRTQGDYLFIFALFMNSRSLKRKIVSFDFGGKIASGH